jgi:hypothetical protein
MSNPIAKLTPEQLAAISSEGITEDEGKISEQELMQLLGMRPEHVEHSTAGGAGLGAIGEALDRFANSSHATALKGDIKSNFDKQRGATSALAQALAAEQAPTAPGSAGAASSLPMGVMSQPAETPDPQQAQFGALRNRKLLPPFSY